MVGPLTNCTIKTLIKKYSPSFALRWLARAGFYKGFSPTVGQVQLGDLARLSPFSTRFGYDRGGPVDRYYIENFLQRHSSSIRGQVLEIGDNAYTLQFGGNQVLKSDVLHIESTNPQATLVGDLSDAPHIPDNQFDCIILTQTLHLIYDFKRAIQTCKRILKPGGVLLLTTPGISHIGHDQWGDTWLWSFTSGSIGRLLAEVFSAPNTTVESHGNVLIATAFLYGLGIQEVTREQLDFHDPYYQVIITAKAVKSSAS